MSSIAITGGATGTGVISLLAPVTNTNRTINLPDSNGTIVTSATAGVPINGPAFSAYQSSAQTLSSATNTKLTFTTEEFDTNNCFASSTFTPTIAGYYQVSGGFTIGSFRTGMSLSIYKNGSNFKKIATDISANQAQLNGSALVYLNGTTDYIDLYGQLAGGQAVSTGAESTYFQAAMVRSAV